MASSACNVLGIDLSSHAIDLVLLDENANRAQWTRIDLEGTTAFGRARDVAEKMPQPGWYEAHGVYLCCIERPFVRAQRTDVIRLIEGCVVAEIPRDVTIWECGQSTWKKHIGFKGKGKPTWYDLEAKTPGLLLEWTRFGSNWSGFSMVPLDEALKDVPQDALDALGCALWARDTNAAIVALALAGAA